MKSEEVTHMGGIRPSVQRFALGITCIAVLVAGSATWRASASVGPAESTFVPVTPTRILDTRDPADLGLAGPFVSPSPLNLKVTGSIPTANGAQVVVPEGASGVTLNVTVVAPTADGFISIRPGGTPGAPTTSSLNFQVGQTTPNAVTVSLPTSGATAGVIEITYDAYGQIGPFTDILIDVLGYTTTAGIQSIVAELALKANAADVYTRSEIDSMLGRAVFAGGEQAIGIGDTFTRIVRTVTLTPPSDGTVIAISSAATNHGNRVWCSITDGTRVDPAYTQMVDGRGMFSGVRGFDVTGGDPLTINLVCSDASLGFGVVEDSSLAAMFFPFGQP